MLFGLALVSALLVRYGMGDAGSRNWVHMVGFALALAVAAYVILDLEFPRLGLIRVDEFDRALESCARPGPLAQGSWISSGSTAGGSGLGAPATAASTRSDTSHSRPHAIPRCS